MGKVVRTTGGLLGLLLALYALPAASQTASILPNAKTQFLDAQGAPVAGGFIYTCLPSTPCGPSTPSNAKTTWKDAFQSVPNSIPVVLDSAGSAFIFGNGNYAEALYDQFGNLIWSGFTSVGSNVTNSANIWTQDQFFISGRPWCDVRGEGAKGDGSTDDTAAFQACLTNITTLRATGGIIFVPPSANAYCVKSGPIVLSANVALTGASVGISMSSCGSGRSVVTASGGQASVQNITLVGPGQDGESTFSATASTLNVSGNGAIISNVIVAGGLHAVFWSASNAQAFNLQMSNTYGSTILFQGASSSARTNGEFFQASTDGNNYPYGIPSPGVTFSSWSTSKTVTLGQVISATCQDGNSYYIQAAGAGTTSASGTGPTCANIGFPFIDGSVTWQLAFAVGAYKWQIDSNASDIHIFRADTGGMTAGIAMTNSLGGGSSAPFNVTCVDCNGGNGYLASFYGLAGGGNVALVAPHFAQCLSANCSALDFTSTFSGGVSVTGGEANASRVALVIAGGTNYRITGMDLTSTAGAAAVVIGGGPSNIVIVGNNVAGYTDGLLMSGTASEVTFVNNVGCVSGDTTCIVNTSSGANNITSPNDDGTAFNLAEAQTTVTGASAATGDMFYRNSGGLLTRLPVCTGTNVIGAAAGVPACVPPPSVGGAMTFLCSIVASNSATLSYASPTTGTCTIDNTYRSYQLVFQNIIPATDQKILELQVHSGGAFKATGYITAFFGYANGTPVTCTIPTTYIPLSCPSDATNQSLHNVAPGFSGTITLTNPSANAITSVSAQGIYIGTTPLSIPFQSSGFWNTAGAVDGFQVLMDSGNITSGQILVYGVQ